MGGSSQDDIPSPVDLVQVSITGAIGTFPASFDALPRYGTFFSVVVESNPGGASQGRRALSDVVEAGAKRLARAVAEPSWYRVVMHRL